MVGVVAEFRGEAGVLSLYFAGGGSAVRVWRGGKGKIPDIDAHAGEIHGLPGAILLPDVQPFSLDAGGTRDGGGRVE